MRPQVKVHAPKKKFAPDTLQAVRHARRAMYTLEDIDFSDERHESWILTLSQSNCFYYTTLNFAMSTDRYKNNPQEKGILAFEGSKAVAFIIYTKLDGIITPNNPAQPVIVVKFHLVDENYRNKSVGTLLLNSVESQYKLRVVSIQVDMTLASRTYYNKMGYNLNFVICPWSGNKINLIVKDSDENPDIKYYHRLILNEDTSMKIKKAMEGVNALMHHLPLAARRDLAELLKK